jgi:predicted PurR-regulated permease PerM
VVAFRARSVLVVVAVVLGVAAGLAFLFAAQSALTLIAISLFLALALNPVVEFLRRRRLRRGSAVAAVYVMALVFFGLLGLVFIPPLVDEVTKFVNALPGLVGDLTRGHGPLGFLERKYHVVERVREATTAHGATGLTGAANPALDILKGVATTLGGLIVIAFLTLFMLLEGPQWRRRFTELVPPRNRPSVERIGRGIYKAVGGFVSGNLLASLLAGAVATAILLVTGVPFAVPVGLLVALVELVPYLGPAVATVLVTGVALSQGVASGVTALVLILIYHMIEGHSLRPLIYGRALKLSALAVLVAILVGTEIAGVLGALAALPIAGSIQVIVTEVLEARKERPSPAAIG